ncbi:Uncharacterized conserved protein, DUF362 family [Singulisphaera sp. GP187]|uniref:DUF362 domain-containing protein n=1 Tax=Singulisphaera sp. GP187 TaxID=1882752 RepID=UPI00092B48DE|nr:DUF362 domain-containing protein [Singulisphaera sp. GP187]SIO46765.1 Uncharacterized conserved protein, DUF362 family [Singulisphaera sp. GP187]
MVHRRKLILGAGAATACGLGGFWTLGGRRARTRVFVGKATSYDDDLEGLVRRGLSEIGYTPDQFKDRSVLIKPNLVDPIGTTPHANTHPKLLCAAVEVFRRWGAGDVVVGEGQGLSRDSDQLLEASSYGPFCRERRIDVIDLNFADVVARANRTKFTSLGRFYLPRVVAEADFVVSMPKLKTHHWAGVTLAAKNLFGVLPGTYYGWPKNVLHWAGIHQSILDIACLVRPRISIVDGIVGMEGDGPLLGTAKPLGAVVIGADPFAVDATATRLMGMEPERIAYLREAAGRRLGAVSEGRIQQVGERLADSRSPFVIPRGFSSLNHADSY